MAWVKFTGPFDWNPPEFGGRTTLTFQPGQRRSVTAACAHAAIEAGRAHKSKTPTKIERLALEANRWFEPAPTDTASASSAASG